MQTRSSNHTWGYDLKLFEISYGDDGDSDRWKTYQYVFRASNEIMMYKRVFFDSLIWRDPCVAIFLSTPFLVFCIYLLPLDVWLSIKVNANIAECYLIESTDITSRLWHRHIWLRLIRSISSVCAGRIITPPSPKSTNRDDLTEHEICSDAKNHFFSW